MNRAEQWLAFLDTVLKIWVPIGGLLFTLYKMYVKWLEHKVDIAKHSSLAGEIGIKLMKLCEGFEIRFKEVDIRAQHQHEVGLENKANINSISQGVSEIRNSHVKDLQLQLENMQRGNRP